jgi:hypothetical protein
MQRVVPTIAVFLFLIPAVHADADGAKQLSPKQLNSEVERLRTKGAAVRATIPIFSQILAISFPRGFVPVREKTGGPIYMQESVPAGETVENWTQMLTIIGAEHAALNPALPIERVVSFNVDAYRRACPGSLARMDLDAKFEGLEGRAAVVSCGTVRSAQESQSESMLFVILKGTEDYYTIQWATSGPASPTALHLQRKEWMRRLRELEPIKLCPRLAGERPPYPSCI